VDFQIRQYLIRAEAGDSEAAEQYLHAVIRANETLELSVLPPIIDKNIDLIQNYIYQGSRRQLPALGIADNILLEGNTIQEIKEQIESSALNDIQTHFGIDPNQPPADSYPDVCYIGWHPVGLIGVFSTQREQMNEVHTDHFWYAIYTYREVSSSFSMVEAWNPSNAPQEVPPLLETIEANHLGILRLYDELDACGEQARVAWQEYTDAEEEAEQEFTQALAQEIIGEAEDNLSWTYDELSEIENLGVGQFANRKIDNGRVVVLLSRMTKADGARFNHAVEVEIWNPVNQQWRSYAEYPSHPEDPDYGQVYRP